MHGGDRHHFRMPGRQCDHAVVAGADRVEIPLPRLVWPAEPHRPEPGQLDAGRLDLGRSEEHTSELQSLMRISYAVFCLKKQNNLTLQQLIIHNTLDNTILLKTNTSHHKVLKS